MNILHLKYVVEVAKTRSISKAAENLYMGQPNLSRAIKELETRLGINIFVRTMRGINLTPEGEQFLEYARRIVSQVDELENMYENGRIRQRFSIYASKGIGVSEVITKLAMEISREAAADIYYNEGNNDEVIDAVFGQKAGIGIIRYKLSAKQQYGKRLADKRLESKVIADFEYRLLMSKSHSLAQLGEISPESLNGYTEIICESSVERLRDEVIALNVGRNTGNRIYESSLGIALSMLGRVTGSYMWTGSISEEELLRYGLVARKTDLPTGVAECEDLLIWRAGYNFSDMDKKFLAHLTK